MLVGMGVELGVEINVVPVHAARASPPLQLLCTFQHKAG